MPRDKGGESRETNEGGLNEDRVGFAWRPRRIMGILPRGEGKGRAR
jgi:hypothetical protein